MEIVKWGKACKKKERKEKRFLKTPKFGALEILTKLVRP